MTICARCEHFGLRDHPKHASEGLGRCSVEKKLQPGTPAASIAMFRPWAAKACGKYEAARQMAPRDKWIKMKEGKK